MTMLLLACLTAAAPSNRIHVTETSTTVVGDLTSSTLTHEVAEALDKLGS